MPTFDWSTLTDLTERTEQEQEMGKRYQNCFVVIETVNGNKYPVKYSGFSAESMKHRFISKKYGDVILDHITEAKIIPFFPQNGLYQWEDKIFYFYRVPSRQWKRGVHNDNASVVDLATHSRGKITDDLYEEMWKHQDKPVNKLPETTALISREWAFVKQHNNLVLHYFDVPVGHVVDGGIVITSPQFFQEVLDYFGRNYPKWKLSIQEKS